MVARFMPFAASAARCLPTGIEPVNEIVPHFIFGNEMFGDGRRHAEHEIEHAGRQARVGKAAHHFDARARRFLGRLENERTAGGELAPPIVAGRRQRREVTGVNAVTIPSADAGPPPAVRSFSRRAREVARKHVEMVRCFADAGLPPGMLNLVFGVPATISEHLIAEVRERFRLPAQFRSASIWRRLRQRA